MDHGHSVDEQLRDAVGDIVIFLASFCNSEGVNINFGEAVRDAWDEVKERDWQVHPVNGVSE